MVDLFTGNLIWLGIKFNSHDAYFIEESAMISQIFKQLYTDMDIDKNILIFHPNI